MLDLYVPSIQEPLPRPARGVGAPRFIAFDAPQSLPRPGASRRQADAVAQTPTKRLPANRDELAGWKAYQGLIEAGIEIFWSAYANRHANIWGLPTSEGESTTILETYPRHVIRCLWPDLRIPSKRKAPLQYVEEIWGRIREMGYSCPSVERPAVDHVDAMLCALAARACALCADAPGGTVGCDPFLDVEARVLREGWIVSPRDEPGLVAEGSRL